MDWPRFWLTLTVVAICVLLGLLLLVGWRRRAGRQSTFPPPPQAPAEPGAELRPALSGVYVSTTTSGDWQDRIVVHGVGRRARAELRLTAAGLLIDRTAEEPIWIPRADLRAIDTTRGVAGKVMGLSDGILLLTWSWNGVAVDTGFRADDPVAQAEWIPAALRLVVPQSGAHA